MSACAVFLMLAGAGCVLTAQTASRSAQPNDGKDIDIHSPAEANSKPAPEPTARARRRAARIFLEAGKLFLAEKFEAAMGDYQEAAKLDPTNQDYAAAVEVARDHEVTALVQAAAKDRLSGNEAGARAALAQGLALEPTNPEVTQHLYELGDDALRGQEHPLYEQQSEGLGEAIDLAPSNAIHSFHMRTGERQVVEQVFKAYGIDAMVDDSVRTQLIRLDVDDASFADAMRVLSLATNSFYVPIDEHHVLVARDTRANRTEFSRQLMETIFLGGLNDTEMTEVRNLARNVFGVQTSGAGGGIGGTQPGVVPARPSIPPPAQRATPFGARPGGLNTQPATAAEPETPGPSMAADTMTLRAPEDTLNAFNKTMRGLLEGQNQVMLEVRLIQIIHSNTRNTGVQPPQSLTAVNVYAEEQSILNANQSLVQQIISSGLASPGDTLAILGILLASGQVSSSLFNNGIALFGGGLTASALSPGGPATFNFNLNTSDSRLLDDIQLRLGDNEAGTLKLGERYPIQTSAYSSVTPNLPNIPGLTGAGASGSLSSLVSSLTSSVPPIPQIQYQDLGLTLKVTPKVLRGDDIALTVDMKIDALSGTFINGNPVLNSQSYSGVVTLKEGEAVEVASELNKSQSRAVSGTPGLSEIPGMNDITDKEMQSNYATMVMVITPHLVRGTQSAGHTPMILVDKNALPQ